MNFHYTCETPLKHCRIWVCLSDPVAQQIMTTAMVTYRCPLSPLPGVLLLGAPGRPTRLARNNMSLTEPSSAQPSLGRAAPAGAWKEHGTCPGEDRACQTQSRGLGGRLQTERRKPPAARKCRHPRQGQQEPRVPGKMKRRLCPSLPLILLNTERADKRQGKWQRQRRMPPQRTAALLLPHCCSREPGTRHGFPFNKLPL